MLRSFVTKSLPIGNKSSKKMAQELCEEAGLVYFGHVSQRDDEHHIVRGITVSNKHKDDHYCIGTYDTYDVIFVERSDTLHTGKSHVWHIIEVDLKTTIDIPHIFISPTTEAAGLQELLKAKQHTMLPHTMGSVWPYPPSFTSTYTVNVTPANALAAEHLLTPEVAEKLATHFNGLSLEITQDAIYIYTEKSHVTTAVLMTMLTNGVWLAQQLDKNSRLL